MLTSGTLGAVVAGGGKGAQPGPTDRVKDRREPWSTGWGSEYMTIPTQAVRRRRQKVLEAMYYTKPDLGVSEYKWKPGPVVKIQRARKMHNVRISRIRCCTNHGDDGERSGSTFDNELGNAQ